MNKTYFLGVKPLSKIGFYSLYSLISIGLKFRTAFLTIFTMDIKNLQREENTLLIIFSRD